MGYNGAHATVASSHINENEHQATGTANTQTWREGSMARTGRWSAEGGGQSQQLNERDATGARKMFRDGGGKTDELDLSSVLGDTRAYLYSPVLG